MSNPLIYIDNLSVASPCPANWNEMTGNEQVRHCDQCQLNVYNLSGMSRQAAEQLIQEKEGKLCVRYFQREDGTILTQDCPVGIQAKYRRKLMKNLPFKIAGTTAAAIVLISAIGVFTTTAAATEFKGDGQVVIDKNVTQPNTPQKAKFRLGQVAAPPSGTQTNTQGKGNNNNVDNQTQPPMPTHTMGKPAYHPPNPPVSPEVKKPDTVKKQH